MCKDTEISSHLLACRFKFSESEPCLKRSNTLFAFLTVLMPVCELDYACQYIPLCTYVFTYRVALNGIDAGGGALSFHFKNSNLQQHITPFTILKFTQDSPNSFSLFTSLSYSLFLLSLFISLWRNTRPLADTTGSLELANPWERSHSSYEPSLGLPTWGSVLLMSPWGPEDMGEVG